MSLRKPGAGSVYVRRCETLEEVLGHTGSALFPFSVPRGCCPNPVMRASATSTSPVR